MNTILGRVLEIDSAWLKMTDALAMANSRMGFLSVRVYMHVYSRSVPAFRTSSSFVSVLPPMLPALAQNLLRCRVPIEHIS